MLLGKERILELIKNQGLIEDYIDLEAQLQPCGFDLTVDKVLKPKGPGTLAFDNSERILPDYEDITQDEMELCQGHYIVQLNETVALPKDIAAFVLPRSSLMRMGCTLVSALWDPGYRGKGRLLLIVGPMGLRLKRNARIGQMIFFEARGSSLYNGSYQGEGLK